MRIKGYLTEHSVLHIFACRPLRGASSGAPASYTSCSELARKYKVAAKTVREIWNCKSWTKLTKPYWSPAEIEMSEAERRESKSERASFDSLSSCSSPSPIEAAVTRSPDSRGEQRKDWSWSDDDEILPSVTFDDSITSVFESVWQTCVLDNASRPPELAPWEQPQWTQTASMDDLIVGEQTCSMDDSFCEVSLGEDPFADEFARRMRKVDMRTFIVAQELELQYAAMN
jgi:hypothetical protein